MEVQDCSHPADDGFSDFVNDRTGKHRLSVASQNDLLSPETLENQKNVYASEDNVFCPSNGYSDLHRSDGSGSENGADHFRDNCDLWYKNEKQLSDKLPLASIHGKQMNTKLYSPMKYSSSKIDAVSWRSERMQSFESNKEFIGSDSGSRLSLFSQSKGDWDTEDEWEDRPTGERWPPLGAPNDDDESICSFEEFGR